MNKVKTNLLRHQRTKPSPEYGSRQRATSRDGYNSHCIFIERQMAIEHAWDIYKKAAPFWKGSITHWQ